MIQVKVIKSITDCYPGFVERIYNESFPPDERRNYAVLVDLCVNNPKHTFNLIVKGEIPVGMLVSWRFSDFLFLEHFAVDHHLRGRGIGKDAIRLWLSSQSLPVILEVEPPIHNLQQRRINFYEQLGFRLWNVDYEQPPYSREKNPVRLLLMSYGDIDVGERLEEIKRILHKEVYSLEVD